MDARSRLLQRRPDRTAAELARDSARKGQSYALTILCSCSAFVLLPEADPLWERVIWCRHHRSRLQWNTEPHVSIHQIEGRIIATLRRRKVGINPTLYTTQPVPAWDVRVYSALARQWCERMRDLIEDEIGRPITVSVTVTHDRGRRAFAISALFAINRETYSVTQYVSDQELAFATPRGIEGRAKSIGYRLNAMEKQILHAVRRSESMA